MFQLGIRKKELYFRRPDGVPAGAQAEGSAPEAPVQEPAAEQAEGQPQKEGRTFTQAEVDAIIAQRLGRAHKKAGGPQQPAQSKVLDEMAEVERLASMTPEDRAAYVQRRQQEQRQKEYDEREAAITRRENRAEVLTTLGDLGLPREIADVIDLSSQDASADALKTLAPVLVAWADKRHEAKVQELTRGKPPQAGSPAAVDEMDLSAVFGVPRR